MYDNKYESSRASRYSYNGSNQSGYQLDRRYYQSALSDTARSKSFVSEMNLNINPSWFGIKNKKSSSNISSSYVTSPLQKCNSHSVSYRRRPLRHADTSYISWNSNAAADIKSNRQRSVYSSCRPVSMCEFSNLTSSAFDINSGKVTLDQLPQLTTTDTKESKGDDIVKCNYNNSTVDDDTTAVDFNEDQPSEIQATQVQTMSGSDFSEFIMLPNEWKKGDDVVTWPKHHQYFNLLWLENTWKYIRDNLPNDLGPIENYNLAYVNNHRERYITLYKLSRHQSSLLFCSKQCLLNPHMNYLQRALSKLDITVVDGFPDLLTNHADFTRYVPRLEPIGLMKILRNRLVEQGSPTLLSQSVNSLLSEKDIKCIRSFLSRLKRSELNHDELECLKHLPLFDNATCDVKEKYISLSSSSYLCYENGPRLPFLHSHCKKSMGTNNILCTGTRSIINSNQNVLRPCIHVQDQDSKKLLELLNQHPVEFGIAARQLVINLPDSLSRVINNSSNQGSNGISGNNGKTVNENVSNIGKWLLCNCERILLTDNLCRDCIRPLHLFHNQSRDLCSASQLIDPSRSDKYVSILGSRFLPANDLCTDHNLALLRSLGMRSIYELKGEEIVEICEAVRTMPKSRRQLLASLLLTVICGDFGKTLLSEPVNVTGGARCTVKVFLYSFPWVPISHKRPSNYPSSLTWKYDQHSKSTNDEDDCQFMAPHDVLDKRQAHIGGSEIFVSDLDIRNEHISKFAFKKCGVDIVVRHLKNVVSSYALMHDRVEYLEYLNITKECYDALQKLDSILVQAELHSIKLKEWIWNGIGSFSAPEAIFLIDKNHALAHFFTVIPYEMYAFVDFFERIGVSRFPLVTVFLDLLNNQSFESELFRKSRELQISFFKWAREVYTDRRVLVAVNDLEKKSASLLSSALNLNNVAHNISGQQAVAKSSFVDNQQKANTYLSDTANNSNSANDYLNKSNADKLFPHAAYSTTSSASSTQMVISIPWCLVKDQIGTVEALKFAISSIVKNEEIVINCTGGTGSAANSLNGVAFDMDHYRLYDEILLPNLNVFSRNVKDTIVLLALDNCDIHMMSILKKHLCIPVTPNGHTLRRPEKLVHPKCILSLMYSDVEGYFPYGSEDTYLRKDRLDVLRLLGMKFDEVSWSELAERAELIANVKDRQLANQKAHGLLAIFRLMLNRYNQSELLNNDEIKSACRIMSECAFYPVMDKPSQSYPLHWADKLSSTHLAKPCELIEHKYWQVGSATFPVCVSNGTSLEHVLLNFHKLTITDCLNQLHEISKLSTPLSDELIEIGYVVEVADACYSFIIQNSKSPDFNQTYVRDFFSRNRILLSNSNLYFSNQVFSNISQSVPPYFISQSCSGLPLTLLRSVLAIPEKPTLNQLLSFIRIGSSNCTGKTSGIFWTSQLSIFNLIGDIIDGSNSLAATNVQIPDDLPIPNTEGIMHPLFKFKQPHSCGQQQIVHSAVDYRFQKHTNIAPNDCINSVKLCLPESLNDNLKHILIHIDHASIDQRLRDALCDHDPNIILEFILAAERAHPIKYLLSNYHAGVLLSYFDDQLKVGAGNFQKLRELCLFRSIWPSHEVQTSNYMNSDLLTSIDQYKQVFMVSPQMAHLLASLFEKCPLCNVNSNSMSTCGGVGTNCVSQNYNNPGSCCVLTHWHNTYCYDQQFTARESFFGDISSRILSHLHIVALKDVDAFLQLCLPFLVDIQNQHYDSNKVRMAFRHLYECISPQQLAVHEQIRLQEIIGARLLLPNCENPPRFVQCSQLYHPHNADLLASFINVVNDVISNDLKYVHDYLPLRKTLSAQRIVEIGKDIEKSVHLTQQWSDSNRHKSECLYRLLTNCQQQMDELKNAGVNFANIAFLEPFQYTSSLVNILPLFESNIVHSTVLCLSEGIPTQYAQLAWSSSFVLPDFVDPKFGRSLSPQLVLRHLFNIGELLNNNINATSTHHDFKSSKQNNNLLGPPSTALFVDSQVRSSLLQIFKHIYQYLEECLSGQLQNAAATTEDTSDFWWSPSEILDDIQMRPVMYSENTGQVIESYKVALQLEIEDEVPPFLYAVPKSLLSCRKCSSLFQRIGCKNDVSAECYSKILCKMARVCYSDYLNSNEVRKVLKISELFFRSIAKQHPTSRSSTCDEFQFDGLFFLSNHLKLKKSSDLIVMDQRENMDYITKLPDVHFLFNPNESVLNLDVLVTPNDHKPFDEGLLSLHSRCANVKCIEKIVQSQRPTLFSEKFEENFSVTIPDDSQRHRVLYALERKFAQLLNSRTLHRCLARMLADAMARSKTDMRIVSVDEMEALLRSRMSLVRLVCCEYLEINLLDKYTNKIVEGTAEERAVLLTDTKQPNLHKIVGITDPSQFFFTLYISFKHAEQTYFSACLSKAILPLFNDVRQHVDKAVLASLISCSIAHMSRLLDLIGLCTDENILSTLKLNYIPGPGRLYGDEITLLHPFSSESHRLVPGDLCVYKRMSDSAFVYCRFIRFGLKTDSVIILADLDSRIDHLNFGSVSTVAGNSSDDIFVRYGGGDSNDPNINMLSSSTKWRKLAIETEITGANLFVLENWSRMHDAVDVNPISEQEFDQQETRHQANNNIGDVEFSNASCSMVDLTEEERFMLDNAKTLVDSELRDVYIQFNGNGVEDRKKRVKRLLLKWHPDKNQGNEKFASEVFKHLKKQVELYDIEMPNSSLGSFSSLFTNFKWPSSSAFNSASGMSSNGGMPGSTADNLFSSSKFGGSFDNIHTSSNGTDGAANIGSQGYTSQFTNAATDEHARSRSGTTTPPSRSNSFRTAREEWQWRRQQGFGRRTGFFTADDNSTFPNSSNQGSGGPTATDERRKSGWQYGNGGNGKSNGGGSSPPNNHYHQQANTESQRWLRQAHVDVASANNDLCPIPPSKPSYEWACYKCYRSAEKALKAYHYSKSPGKILATDIPTLLFGVDSEVRSIGYRLYKWLSDPNKMQYPNLARFAKIPNEVYTATQAEKSIEYTRELIRKVEEMLNRSTQATQQPHQTHECAL
ncbi:hypothetical protein GJ496_003085 [Pomphorhynchus laevis]|nr:hypothetical protein GJ496_003085 [Pomphorhynchus laevis]